MSSVQQTRRAKGGNKHASLAGRAYELGLAAAEACDWPQAVRLLRTAAHQDAAGAVQNSLAVALWAAGKHAESRKVFARALRRFPSLPELHANHAKMLFAAQDWKRARVALESALPHVPDPGPLLRRLAELLQAQGYLTDGSARWLEYLSLNPDDAAAWNNYGVLLLHQGKNEQARRAFARSCRREFHPAFASNALLAMLYDTSLTASRVFAQHRQWANRIEAPETLLSKPARRPVPVRRRLRIGYVSGDLKRHSVACFLEPLLEHHDPHRFEVHCFSNTGIDDRITRRLQKYAIWHDIAQVDDERCAAAVRRARIDILVDLSGHTALNRLPVFARRPAPVQATYLGYPCTTGLRSIDYRFTDSLADPPQSPTVRSGSEILVRIDPCFLSYRPPEPFLAGPSPVSRTGLFTFASFAIREKLSLQLLEAWSRILAATPGTRLLLKCKSVLDDTVREDLERFFEARGIGRERLILAPYTPSPRRHLEDYHRIDLILDSFPFNGTTATCEALSAGVPVLTWSGNSHAARVGASILENAGLPQLRTANAEEYIRRASEIASDPTAAARLRAEVRRNWSRSALVDAVGLTARIEACYRDW